jgi:hypothetical protein
MFEIMPNLNIESNTITFDIPREDFIDSTNTSLAVKIPVIPQILEEKKDRKDHKDRELREELDFQTLRDEFSETRKEVIKLFIDDEEKFRDFIRNNIDCVVYGEDKERKEDVHISKEDYNFYFEDPSIELIMKNMDDILDKGVGDYLINYGKGHEEPLDVNMALRWIENYIHYENYGFVNAFYILKNVI